MVTAHLRSVGGGRTHPLGKPVAKLPARARACGPSRSPWSRKARAGADCSARRYTPRAIVVPEVGERRKVSSPSRVTMAGEETRETVGRRTTLRGSQGRLGCRRRRRGPQVRQECGQADAAIARSAPPGAAAPLPRGAMRSQGVHTDTKAGSQGSPSQLEDCHQSKQVISLQACQLADLHVCAPGRTRTCTLRIRSYRRYFSLICWRSVSAVQRPCNKAPRRLQ